MKKMGKFLKVMAVGFILLGSITANAKPFYDNSDPRVQLKDNKVTISVLNMAQEVYTVQVFSRNNTLLHEEVLGNGHLVGKIFDFNNSKKGMYRIAVSSKGGTLIDQRLWLGKT